MTTEAVLEAPAAPRLAWSADLALDCPRMDDTHEAFIALLARTAEVPADQPAERLARWQMLVEHTVEHFAQEERWMQATGFSPENCHGFQHQAVLQVMNECTRLAREEGDEVPLRRAIDELALWFPQHAKTMDAGLAIHMREVGYDPQQERFVRENAMVAATAPRTGCGSASCG